MAAAAIVIGVAFGSYRRLTDGSFKARRTPIIPVAAAPKEWNGYRLGERATLVQFSSAFCAPCRVTRRILEDVVAGHDDLVHLDIDAELELELVRKVGITRTPTTLILDASGVEVVRASGAPRKEQVLSALASLVPAMPQTP